MHSSQACKYAFDGTLLAIGCHDKRIYLYSVSAAGNLAAAAPGGVNAGEAVPFRTYAFLACLEGHQSFVTHLDFGVALTSSKKVIEMFDKHAAAVLTFPAPVKDAPHAPKPAALVPISEGTDAKGGDEKPTVSSRPMVPADLCLVSASEDKDLQFWSCRSGTWARVETPAALKVRP